MDEFQLPVTYNNETVYYTTVFLQYGYSYKLQVDIAGTPVFFEPDEERNWRAMLSYEDMLANKKLDAALLRAIAQSIEELFK